MYALHGTEFISTFFGVHNVLRATVAEHGAWNVWYFYPAIFLVIFFPWSFLLILPLIRRLRKGLRGIAPDTLFLLIWALGVNAFFQVMATKYSTYTLPALMPFALLTARLLMPYGHVMRRLALAAACIVGGGQLSYSLQLTHWTDVSLRLSTFRDSRGIVWSSCSRENGRHPC